MEPVFKNKVAIIAYFNAGVRAVDVREPFHPKEVGYFIPSSRPRPKSVASRSARRTSARRRSRRTTWRSDERGYIYAVDRANTGMHILELTGDAKSLQAAY